MATPADHRLLDIMDKWLKSLELHTKYCTLDDSAYRQVQPWPDHQRPSRWIIELAMQKAETLRAQIEERIAMGDEKFSDSLELMTFLANLVGSEHIERFIPLANPATERAPDTTSEPAAVTREMPKLVLGGQRPSASGGTVEVARTEHRVPTLKPENLAPPLGREAPAPEKPALHSMHEVVIADATRLVQWGRKWYELAELISGMADRPSLIEVRRILKDNKTVIDKKAGRG